MPRCLTYFVKLDFCCCSEVKREGIKIVSQTENVVKEITVHVISVLVVD